MNQQVLKDPHEIFAGAIPLLQITLKGEDFGWDEDFQLPPSSIGLSRNHDGSPAFAWDEVSGVERAQPYVSLFSFFILRESAGTRLDPTSYVGCQFY